MAVVRQACTLFMRYSTVSFVGTFLIIVSNPAPPSSVGMPSSSCAYVAIYIYIYIYIYICMCVCVCIYIYMCVCVCVCGAEHQASARTSQRTLSMLNCFFGFTPILTVNVTESVYNSYTGCHSRTGITGRFIN